MNKVLDFGSTVVLQVRTTWRVIIGVAAGFVVGYVTMEFRLGRALTAAHEAKSICEKLDARLEQLATEREVSDVNHRLDDVVAILSHAEAVSKEPPKPQRRRK